MRIFNRKQIKEVQELANKTYDANLELVEFAMLSTSKKEKLWVTNRGILENDFKPMRLNSVGVYFGRIHHGKLRLSIEGAQMVGKTAKKNVAEITKEQVWDFIRGFDVSTETESLEENAYVLVKNNEDILGIAKYVSGTLENILPKSRKLTSLTKPK